MDMTVQPARKPGSVKTVLSRPIVDSDVSKMEDGSVILTIVAQDVYSEKSRQRYDITLSRAEIELLARA